MNNSLATAESNWLIVCDELESSYSKLLDICHLVDAEHHHGSDASALRALREDGAELASEVRAALRVLDIMAGPKPDAQFGRREVLRTIGVDVREATVGLLATVCRQLELAKDLVERDDATLNELDRVVVMLDSVRDIVDEIGARGTVFVDADAELATVGVA